MHYQTEGTRRKISKTMKLRGIKPVPHKVWNKGLKGVQKGYWTGKKRSPETIEKLRQAKLGKPSSMKDKHFEQFSKDKHWNWQGGKSFEIYPEEFNRDLKHKILERDNFQCQVCDSKKRLIVHHRDKNKINCNKINLITLCRSCHARLHNNFKGKLKS